ncbi:response regulator transcription factor [Specibacter sp. NPDC057265]|uniref:response regulator transcription factor n=1 Tax=Specibacter sp. NPDC057265 TaxID=3346075 RepID=UPI00362A31A6
MEQSRVAVVIEDDQDIRELIVMVLGQSGFEVHAVSNGADGVEAVRRHQPVIITLDLGLPDIDGFEVARRIRLFSDSYIIMLTARAEELDTLLGLESGADDYLTKPFRPRELRARVSAMLRRPHIVGAPAAQEAPAAQPAPASAPAPDAGPEAPVSPAGDTLVHNGLALNRQARTVSLESGELELTRTEFDLLQALLQSGNMVRTKADLVRRLRGDEYDTGGYISDSDERTIEVHMANLRRKLGDDPRNPRWIKTVRGVGYRLAA